jgi:hypothetical protein
MMNFGEALQALKANKMVQRAGWNGQGLYLEPAFAIRTIRTISKIRQYLVIVGADGEYQGVWSASQADILADDWQLILTIPITH